VKQSFGEPDFVKKFKNVDVQVRVCKGAAGSENKEQWPGKVMYKRLNIKINGKQKPKMENEARINIDKGSNIFFFNSSSNSFRPLAPYSVL
jgi:hypothetical protein